MNFERGLTDHLSIALYQQWLVGADHHCPPGAQVLDIAILLVTPTDETPAHAEKME